LTIFIYCPQCEYEATVSHGGGIAKGQSQRCGKCEMDFNIFTVYKSFYEDIPTAKKIADEKVALAKKKYKVIGNNSGVRIIDEFFKRTKFDLLYSQIISDLVIYANAFIEKNSELTELVRHDPATSIINTEVVGHGNFPEEVVYLITKVGKRMTSEN
jgi:hypothetical protein